MKVMNPKPNISLVDALIRITCGFTFLAWSTAKLSRKPYKQSYLLIALLAGMKIAEGIVRYCPIVALFDKKDLIPNMGSKNNHEQHRAHKPNPNDNTHKQESSHEHHESPGHEGKKTSSPAVAEMMAEFSPEKIFSADDMKK